MVGKSAGVSPVKADLKFGDYEYSLEKFPDGTYRCQRRLLNVDGYPPDDYDDWAQLPPEVRAAFTAIKKVAGDPINGTLEARHDPH
jgi:hypothetical protein